MTYSSFLAITLGIFLLYSCLHISFRKEHYRVHFQRLISRNISHIYDITLLHDPIKHKYTRAQ